LGHGSIANVASKLAELTKSNEDTKYFSLRSLGDLNEQFFSVLVPVACGSKVYFGESESQAVENLHDVQPNIFLSPSKNWRALAKQLQAKIPLDKVASTDSNKMLLQELYLD